MDDFPKLCRGSKQRSRFASGLDIWPKSDSVSPAVARRKMSKSQLSTDTMKEIIDMVLKDGVMQKDVAAYYRVKPHLVSALVSDVKKGRGALAKRVKKQAEKQERR